MKLKQSLKHNDLEGQSHFYCLTVLRSYSQWGLSQWSLEVHPVQEIKSRLPVCTLVFWAIYGLEGQHFMRGHSVFLCQSCLDKANVFSSYLPENIFIPPSNLNDSLLGERTLGWRFSSFSTLTISFHSQLPVLFHERILLWILRYFPSALGVVSCSKKFASQVSAISITMRCLFCLAC